MWYNLNKRIILTFGPPLIKLLGLSLPTIGSAVTIIEKDGKILAVNLAYKNGYSLPGGGVNKGETLEEAVIREVKEETNLTLENPVYFGSEAADMKTYGVVSALFIGTVTDLTALSSSTEGEVTWEDPRFVWEHAAYKDVKRHLGNYFGFK
jgi:ADP-ribose pyrophosphatase YjhB (NUDIX family)